MRKTFAYLPPPPPPPSPHATLSVPRPKKKKSTQKKKKAGVLGEKVLLKGNPWHGYQQTVPSLARR